MLGIPPTPCPTEAVTKLTEEQAAIDALAHFHERTEEAKRRWDGRTSNRAFDAVRETLRRVRPGGHFCCYCENNSTSAIDHIYPKSLYPERTFLWENYLLACYRCNSEEKKAKWATFDALGNIVVAAPPPTGTPVFLNPRTEDPLALIHLDFGKWELLPRPEPPLPPQDYQRIVYTLVTVLDLNDPAICLSRKTGYGYYCHQLQTYRDRCARFDPNGKWYDTRKQIAARWAEQNITNAKHPTVWREMKRQRHKIAKLNKLFDGIPEALDW